MARRTGALRVIPEDDGGLTLEDLFSETVTFEMTVRGRRLEVTWAPARFTPVLEEKALALTSPAEDETEEGLTPEETETRRGHRIRDENVAVRDFLSGVLVSWSLRAGDGTAVGTDAETLRTLPPAFLREVFAAMTENAGPKEPSGVPSAPTS